MILPGNSNIFEDATQLDDIGNPKQVSWTDPRLAAYYDACIDRINQNPHQQYGNIPLPPMQPPHISYPPPPPMTVYPPVNYPANFTQQTGAPQAQTAGNTANSGSFASKLKWVFIGAGIAAGAYFVWTSGVLQQFGMG